MYFDFKGFDKALYLVIGTLVVCIPLAIWKIIELIYWMIKHFRIEYVG